MLSVHGRAAKLCDGITRREVLRVGALAMGGLTLADVLRCRASQASEARREKSVILVWLRGGPSHIDSYDMKPEAPPEIRGEFSPISTNVPGVQVCELMPKHATMMDRLAVIRGIRSNDLGDHTPHYILTGNPDRGRRPAFGSVVSHLQPRSDGLPPYVSLMYERPGLYDNEGPVYLGQSHRPFAPRDEGLENLRLPRTMSLDRLQGRQQLLREFDTLNRAIDARGNMAGVDEFSRRALEMVASPRARDAFDLGQESDKDRERYGKYCEGLLMARRLVEAGIPVVTLKLGDWDTHERNFIDMRDQLPKLDQGMHALLTDLYDRGLERDVAVVVWGEFGRAQRISRGDGRDHWPQAGAAAVFGGGFKVGQVIGETDHHGGESKGKPYTPGNIIATLYRHLGIDPHTTLPDFNGRPVYLVDDRELVRELL